MRSRLLATSSLLVVAAACGSDSSGPKIGPASKVTVTSAPTSTAAVKTAIGTFAVKVEDANGNGVAGNVVNFFASGGGGVNFAPASAVADASGIATTTVTLGTKTGTTQLTAYATGVNTPASTTVTSTPGPLVSLVTTPKSIRFFSVGDTARIAYSLQDEFANTVTAAPLTFAIGDPTLVSVDPQGLVKALRAGGSSTITVSSGGRSDTVGVNVLAAGASACTGISAPTTVAVGSVTTVQGANICLTGAAGAASEYAIVAYNSSPNGSTILSTSITASGVATPPSTLKAPSRSGPLLSRSASDIMTARVPQLDETFHQRLLTQSKSLKRLFSVARTTRSTRLSAGPTSSGRLSPSRASYASIPATVNLNDLVPLNVAYNPCDTAKIRTFRVAAVGAKSIVMADTLNPAGGFSDADYVKFAARFDTLVYPLDVSNFGAPTDLDKNGKVAILFTKYVNELTPANSDFFIGGFFHPRDIFPKVDTDGSEVCLTSNEGEMFYMLVPDPTGVVNGNRHSLGFVDTITTGVLAHEFQHLINAGRRLYVNTGAQAFEDTWLNEGLSHVAEELLYYRESGVQPRQGLTDALIHANGKYPIFKADASSNFTRFVGYIEDPGSWSPIDELNDEVQTRGASWAFLRYAVDRAFPSDAGVWSRFSNSIQTGLNTVADGLQTDAHPFLADFTLANYISDLGISSDPRFVHKSWNFRNIFSITYGTRDANNVFTPLGYYPIELTGLADGVPTSTGVKGGSATYFRLAVPAGREALLNFSSGQGAPNSSFVFSVVRTK
jgi:hypothetical protein